MSDNIPLDVLLDIISRLPVKSILQLRTVSKLWKSSIDCETFIFKYGVRVTDECFFMLTFDQAFQGIMLAVDENLTTRVLDTHLQLSSMMAVGNSNGLSCFVYGSNLTTFIWNSTIKKSIRVFVPFYTNQIECQKICFGFGVRPDTLDLTIVKVCYPVFETGLWYVLVFSLNSLSWIRLENFHPLRETIKLKRKSQAFVGRFIYWAGSETLINDEGLAYKSYMLISFDLTSNLFNVIDIPQNLRNQLPVPFDVSDLRTSLVIFGMNIGFDIPLFCGWVLDVNGASIRSFRILFAIPTQVSVTLLRFTKDHAQIVEAYNGNHLGHSVFVYNNELELFVTMGMLGDEGSFYIALYKESLLLLNHIDRAVYCHVRTLVPFMIANRFGCLKLGIVLNRKEALWFE